MEPIHIEKNPNLTCLFTKDDWEVWEKINSRPSTYHAPHDYARPIFRCNKCNYVSDCTGMGNHFSHIHMGYGVKRINLNSLKVVGYQFRNKTNKRRLLPVET